VLASIGRLPNLTHLRSFLAVGKCLNYREAAARLHMAQFAVTRAIQLLEDELGYRLLERTTRPVALTPAGAHLLSEAQVALSRLATAVRDAKLYHLGTAQGSARAGRPAPAGRVGCVRRECDVVGVRSHWCRSSCTA